MEVFNLLGNVHLELLLGNVGVDITVGSGELSLESSVHGSDQGGFSPLVMMDQTSSSH